MRLENKVVLVTASTRGIGFSIVKRCAQEGAIVYMAARNMERAKEKAFALTREGLAVHCVFNDATKPETFSSMVEEVIQKEGQLDVLVNNFGTSDPTKDLDIARTDGTVFLSTVTTNLQSVFLASQAFIRQADRKGGSIVNISSVSGLVADISQIAYGTAKAAINHLTKLIAVQGARQNIRCNAVLPGMTATEAVESNLTPEFRDLFLRQIPLGRMATPEEIAGAVVYLAGDESAYTTGQILTVSGGFGTATPIYGDMANRHHRR